MADNSTIDKLVADLKAQPWEGVVYRVMLGEAPPDRENTLGARWNSPDVAAIYTSLQAATSIAEVEYNLARQSRPVRPDLKKTLYEIDVRLSAVIDITGVLSRLEKVGAGHAQLFADDMRASQDIGRLITWFGYDGLLAPSARADGANLVIYPSRVNVDSYRFKVREQRSL